MSIEERTAALAVRIKELRRVCGCGAGMSVGILGVGVCLLCGTWDITGPGLAWVQVGKGSVLFLGFALVGKLFGLAVARWHAGRLQQELDRLRGIS